MARRSSSVKVITADGEIKRYTSARQFRAAADDPDSRAAWYPDYIKSDGWKRRRKMHLSNCPRCKACGGKAVLVHHASYESVDRENPGREKFRHLVSLCRACHSAVHRKARDLTDDTALYQDTWRIINQIRSRRS